MTGLFVFEEDCAMHILKLEFHLAGLRSNKSGLATISTMQQRLCCGYCSKLIMAFNHAFKFSFRVSRRNNECKSSNRCFGRLW